MSSADQDVQIQPVVSGAEPKPLVYQQIDSQRQEIRILNLLPGSEDDPIRCTLHTTPLSGTSDYEALSYNWGDPQLCRAIEVDGIAKDVTVNLFNALTRLRLLKEERRLWVDAICINQGDDTEKSHQVNLMSKIYSWGKRALLWLGDSSGDKDAGPNNIPAETANNALSLVRYLADDKHYSPIDGEESDSPTEEQFEAVLPKDALFICGTAESPFAILEEAYLNSIRHNYSGCCHPGHKLLIEFWEAFDGLKRARWNLNTQSTVSETINRFRTRQASDSRDRVYAYLGLVGGVPADYTLPVEGAFKHTSRVLIEKFGTLDILLIVSERGRSSTLPTWVPDWTAYFDHSNFLREMEWLCSYSMFRAASDTKAETRDSLSSDSLELKGFIIGRAVEVGPVLNSGSQTREMLAKWQSNHRNVYPRGGTYFEASWRTITTDIYQSHGRCRRLQSDEDPQALVTEALELDEEGYELGAYGSKGFTTEKGIIGVGHPDMKAEDSICIFKGGNMPFILRQVQRDEGIVAYQYVGQAYVYKMMDGEMINESTEWDWITLV